MMKMMNDIEKFKNNNLTKHYMDDAGLDIKCPYNIDIPAQDNVIIFTGLHISIPKGHVGIIKSRSSMAVNKNIEVSNAGVIDSGYRGEIKILLRNFNTVNVELNKGDRIAQLITLKINLGMYVESEKLPSSQRGTRWLGSTGL